MYMVMWSIPVIQPILVFWIYIQWGNQLGTSYYGI
jgi:hypothetical protein